MDEVAAVLRYPAGPLGVAFDVGDALDHRAVIGQAIEFGFEAPQPADFDA